MNPFGRAYWDYLADYIRNRKSRWWCTIALVLAALGMTLMAANDMAARSWLMISILAIFFSIPSALILIFAAFGQERAQKGSQETGPH